MLQAISFPETSLKFLHTKIAKYSSVCSFRHLFNIFETLKQIFALIKLIFISFEWFAFKYFDFTGACLPKEFIIKLLKLS